jgi:hypothetical protein
MTQEKDGEALGGDSWIALKDILLSGTFIAGVSALGYLITFLYEWGYALEFRIPAQMISPDLATILTVGATLVMIAPLGIIVYGHVHDLAASVPSRTYRRMVSASPLVVILQVALAASQTPWWVFGLVIVMLVMTPLVVFEFVVPLYTQKDKPTFLEKVKANREACRAQFIKRRNEKRPFYTVFTDDPLFVGALLLCVLVVPPMVGNSRARTQVDFLVMCDQPDVAIARIYSNTAIGVRFERGCKSAQPEIIVLDLKGSPNRAMRWEKIGPLRMQDPDSAQTAKRAPGKAPAADPGNQVP